MGIGRDTLHRAFRLICERGTSTRKELAALLETSEVSAGKCASALSCIEWGSDVHALCDDLNWFETLLARKKQ